MAEARLSEADAVRLANRFGRSAQDFAKVVGLTPAQAASELALDPSALNEALAKNAAREPVEESSGAKRAVKKATATAKKAATRRKKDA